MSAPLASPWLRSFRSFSVSDGTADNRSGDQSTTEDRLPPLMDAGTPLKAACLKVVGRTARYMDRIFNSGFHDRFGQRFGSADYRNAGPLRKTFVKVVNEDLSQVAGQINVPVQIVVGEADGETPPEISRRYQDLIAAAGLVVLPGYGHLDILSRGRHQVEARITQFLKEQGLGE